MLSNEAGAASQSVALVEELLSTVDASTAGTASDLNNSLLQSFVRRLERFERPGLTRAQVNIVTETRECNLISAGNVETEPTLA